MTTNRFTINAIPPHAIFPLLLSLLLLAACGRTHVFGNGTDSGPDGDGGREICSNGRDDDGDGLSDCADPDCFSDPSCRNPGFELCGNGVDDDGDGLIDCADSDCRNDERCIPGVEICDNKRDDDGDGLVDCADPNCFGQPICNMKDPENCTNGLDDDGDGLVDCDDNDCNGAANCAAGRERCENKVDDDNDGLVDCQDPDCFKHPSCRQPGAEVCNNGIDDDSDGDIDCKDSDCSGLPICTPGKEICGNQLDDDLDGAVDCDDPDCLNDPSCQSLLCKPSVDFGTIKASGASVTRTLTTTNQKDVYTSPCAVPGGGELVARFELDAPADVKLSYVQKSGDHVLSLFRAGTGEACNANSRGCFDPQSKNSGSFSVPNLQAGEYYLIAEAFAKSLEGQIEVTLSTGTPAGKEVCNNGIDDDQDGATDCADLDCALDPGCQSQICQVDVNLGALVINGPSKVANVDTSTGANNVEETCAAGGGKERVIRVVMPQAGGLAVSVDQSGYHVFGLHEDAGPGTVCTADKGSCFDSNNRGRFQLSYGSVKKGVYYYVVDALAPGQEGTVRVEFRAFANRGPELCANGIDDDGDGLTDCMDPDCTGVVGCPGPVCAAEKNVGVLTHGAPPVSVSVNTTTANNDQTVSCALGGGKDTVIALELDKVSGLNISCTQTGDHVLGLFAAGAPRDPCDKTPVNCADLKNGPFGCNFIMPNLQPGKYFLVVEGFKPGAEGTVSLSLSATPDAAQEICNNGIDDDGDGKIDCQDSNCSSKPLCQGLTCTPDQKLGVLPAGIAKSVAVTTSGAGDSNSASCALGGGEDAVVGLALPAAGTLEIDYAQFGNHVLALFNDKGTGFACDAAPVSCKATNGQSAGKLTWSNLPAGAYYLVSEAVSSGAEGSVVMQATFRLP
ncbi:MAG: hypothetical protein KC503_46125 [Myxococcales bacterium]|nr:hypothetical protein [Myxococcales bacterium]